jgi:hypothetical protein
MKRFDKTPGLAPSIAAISLLFGFLLAPFAAESQIPIPPSLIAIDQDAATTFRAENLPELTPLNNAEGLEPYYEFLWIFGDGNFINKSKAPELLYRYQFPGAAAMTETRAIATSIYSGGAPPPRIMINNSNLNSKAEPSPRTKAVPDGALIHLQRNHTRAVPSHTTTWILSVKHNLDTDINLDGYLLLYYDGLIERIVLSKAGDTLLVPKTTATGEKIFGDFSFEQSLRFDDGGTGTSHLVTDAAIAEHFKKYSLLRFEKLVPGEERHFFIDIKNDDDLLEKAPSEEKGMVRFLAVAVMENLVQSNLAPLFSEEERRRLAEIGIPEFYAGSTVDTPYIAGRVYDSHENRAAISKGHDPNKLTVEACECPPASGLGQKLLSTIEFENDGAGDVGKVIIKMDLPAGMNAYRIPDTLVSSHPAINPADITVTRSGNSITWVLSNMLLRPVMDYGPGHPATYGSITFYAFLEQGVGLEALETLHARIYFDSETAEPVRTPPAEVHFISPDSELYALGGFDCAECRAARDVCWWWPLPWWLIALLAVLLLVLIVFLARRRP